MKKYKFLLKDLIRAMDRLREVLAVEATEINQDASIQRFEFVFELSWKLMKAVLEHEGELCVSPRDCVRKAARVEIIDEPDKWLEFLDDRNRLSHTYDEKEAREVYQRLSVFVNLVNELIEKDGKLGD